MTSKIFGGKKLGVCTEGVASGGTGRNRVTFKKDSERVQERILSIYPRVEGTS